MGGMCFPCVAVKTTNATSFALTLLFNLLTRIAFMLKEALIRLCRLPPTEEEDDDDDYQSNYQPTNNENVLALNTIISPSPSQLVPKSTTLIKTSLPVVKYGNLIQSVTNPDDHSSELMCAVCLNHIEKSDEIRVLSNCSHLFHRQCLDKWISRDQVTCPLCRSTF